MFQTLKNVQRTQTARGANTGAYDKIFRKYNQKVIDYFENPPNVGSLKRKRKDVGTGTQICA